MKSCTLQDWACVCHRSRSKQKLYLKNVLTTLDNHVVHMSGNVFICLQRFTTESRTHIHFFLFLYPSIFLESLQNNPTSSIDVRLDLLHILYNSSWPAWPGKKMLVPDPLNNRKLSAFNSDPTMQYAMCMCMCICLLQYQCAWQSYVLAYFMKKLPAKSSHHCDMWNTIGEINIAIALASQTTEVNAKLITTNCQ